MKTVLTFGVYDLLHIGHILLFKRARELGDRLVVAVQDAMPQGSSGVSLDRQ